MNLKNLRARYWLIAGAVLLLVVLGAYVSVPSSRMKMVNVEYLSAADLREIKRLAHDMQAREVLGSRGYWNVLRLPALVVEKVRHPIIKIEVAKVQHGELFVEFRDERLRVHGRGTSYIIRMLNSKWHVVGEPFPLVRSGK
jgi:hypothetical protein